MTVSKSPVQIFCELFGSMQQPPVPVLSRHCHWVVECQWLCQDSAAKNGPHHQLVVSYSACFVYALTFVALILSINNGSFENSQVSASKQWLTLAALTCNWQRKLVNFD